MRRLIEPQVLGWGAAAALLYVGAALSLNGSGLPILPVFDGVQPPAPYRWVAPPPEFADQNQPALAGSAMITVEDLDQGFVAVTEDGQAQLSGAADAFRARPEERAVRVEIVPRDPARVAPAPPGLRFDGNAYEVRATYRPSDAPVPFVGEVAIVLRYPAHATALLRWTGSRWERLEATPVPAALQVFAQTDEPGVFVAGAPDTGADGFPWSIVASAAGGAALGLAAVAWWRRRTHGSARPERKTKRQQGRTPRKGRRR